MTAAVPLEITHEDKEIRDFLERVIAAGELEVIVDRKRYLVSLAKLTADNKGRDFLVNSKPIID